MPKLAKGKRGGLGLYQRAACDLVTLKELGRWKEIEMVQRYAHLVTVSEGLSLTTTISPEGSASRNPALSASSQRDILSRRIQLERR